MPRPIDRKKLLEEFRQEQANHQAHYDELTANDVEPDRAEYNEHMVQVLEYICDLIEADIADDDQLVETGEKQFSLFDIKVPIPLIAKADLIITKGAVLKNRTGDTVTINPDLREGIYYGYADGKLIFQTER